MTAAIVFISMAALAALVVYANVKLKLARDASAIDREHYERLAALAAAAERDVAAVRAALTREIDRLQSELDAHKDKLATVRDNLVALLIAEASAAGCRGQSLASFATEWKIALTAISSEERARVLLKRAEGERQWMQSNVLP